MPEHARAVVQARIEALSTYAQDALGVCALSARPTVDVVSSVIGPRRARGGLREAADAGVVEVDGGELGFAHPLLTAAAYNSMTLAKRRPLHRRLAAVVDDPSSGDDISPRRDGPDPSVASAFDAAIRDARGRGAPAAGAELLELARRLTDRDDAAALHCRTLKASEYHFEAGDAGTPRHDAIMATMASVEVKQSAAGDTLSFDVTVVEASSATSHRVTLDALQFERLRRGSEGPEQFIERCFEFLLTREPKESILSSFDVSVISRYFPEFEKEISQ